MIDRSLDEILGLHKCPHFVVITNGASCSSNKSKRDTEVEEGSLCWKYNKDTLEKEWNYQDCEYHD